MTLIRENHSRTCQAISSLSRDVQAGFKEVENSKSVKPALNRSANPFFNHALYLER
jgi:hypothetical protein